MPDPIVDEEQELLDEVLDYLRAHPWEAPPPEGEIVDELVRIRDEMQHAKTEDKAALMEQYNRHLALLEQLRETRHKPQVDPDAPYFAHLRLVEGGRSRDLCLGKATRIDKGIRIVDWRNAPISRIYYRYEQGDEYIEDMGDRTLEGVVDARRTVTIRDKRLERIDAPEGVFRRLGDDTWVQTHHELPRLAGGAGSALRAHDGDDARHRRLGTDLEGFRQRADKRLPDIAGLIDAEQFELITQPQSGVVVIRGTAGSGKTTVALHRIAWLAYDDPEIDSHQTLVVVFSKALRDYVDHVLPALEVGNAQVRTFGSWVHRVRRRHYPRLPGALRDDTPATVVRLKQSPVLLEALADQAMRVDGPSKAEQAIDDWASVLSGTDELWARFRRDSPGTFTEAELRAAVSWCRDRLEELQSWLEGTDDEVEAALDPEDDALLLRAWQLRVGPLKARGGKPLRYRHVAIDEVQDFSPLEVRVLLACLDDRQSVTLAGDTQQHVMKEAGFTSWPAFFDHLGLQATTVNTLRVAYRSTKPVVDFALRVLGDLYEDDSPPITTRDGPPVEFFEFSDHGAAVSFLADALNALLDDEPLASVAVLAADPDISDLYHRGLAQGDVPRLRRVQDQDFTFAPGVEVTEIDQVKGLEFDYVILAEVNARYFPDDDPARRLLHVGATRAVHQLWLTSVGRRSPILEGLDATDPAA